MLDEGPTFGSNLRFGSPEKKFSISIRKGKTKFYLSFHYNADNGYLSFYGKEIFKFKADNKNGNIVSKAYQMELMLLSLEKYL